MISFDLKRMIDTELHYTERFTNLTHKPYGLLFWNEGNKDSHDSNHAKITDYMGVDSSLKDIERFYKDKGITPRIYSAFKENELEVLTPHLENHGFEVNFLPDRFFLHTSESRIQPVRKIHYERIKSITPQLLDFIRNNDIGEWTVKVVERHLKHPNYHLLGGYLGDELITVASINIFVGYSRLDDVLTHKFYRSKGYSSSLIHYLIGYHNEHSKNYLYLYSSLPNAIKVYEKAGFTPIAEHLSSWSARKEINTG